MGQQPQGAPHDMHVEALEAVHEDAAELFQRQLPSSWVPGYLATRRLEQCLQPSSVWSVGYAPRSWTWLTDRLRHLGYSDAVLECSGLSMRTKNDTLVDRFRDRLTLGVRDDRGALVGFTCRAAPDADARRPKYVNTPTTPLYRKSEVLFGLGELVASQSSDRVPVLVEGPLDAIAVAPTGTGPYAPLAACGTALTACHADVVANLAIDGDVVVALDSDDAGRQAATHALGLLRSRGIEPWGLRLPEGADPAELVRQSGPAALSSVLADVGTPLVDVVVENTIKAAGERLRWVEGRVTTARAVMPLIAMCSLLHAARLASKVARMCDLAPTTVADELAVELERTTRRSPMAGPSTDVRRLTSRS